MSTLLNRDILTRRVENEARVVFVYPYNKIFVQACKSLKIRGLLLFGDNPILVPGVEYSAWYADLTKLDEGAYAKYAMLVRDFYTTDIRAKFDALFDEVKHDKVTASVHNPSKVMEANREEVNRLVEKYKKTNSPLEFHGSIHQAEGVVLFLQSLKKTDGTKGVINADAPRMGKTRQSVVGAIEGGFKNILVVTTKTAKTAVWPDEIKTVDAKATIAMADHKKYSIRAQWTIIHWDSLRLCDERFFENARTFDLIILDESHYASNEESQRGAATARLCAQIPWVWELTGTPVTKRPRNLIHLLKLIRHPLVSDSNKVWKFLTRYCGEKDEWDRWDFNRAKNLDELRALLQDILIRREKDQTNLPPKVRQIQVVHLTEAQRADYDSAWESYLEIPGNKEKAAKLGYPTAMIQTMVKRKAVSMAKVPLIIAWAEDLLLAGEKVVIFTAFDDVWEAYAKHFGAKAVGIRGEVSPADRDKAVKRFQTDPKAELFIGNIKAAGEAIPLWAGGYLAFNDITWLPHEQLQAEERIVGGTKTTCFITFFLGEGTVDEPGFQDFLKHKAITQQIVNRRDENNKPIDPGFVGDLPIARATEGEKGDHDKEMRKLARLLDTNSLKSSDTSFAESVMNQYLEKGKISDRQLNVIKRMLYRYKGTLDTLGAGK